MSNNNILNREGEGEKSKYIYIYKDAYIYIYMRSLNQIIIKREFILSEKGK